ncbi:hypothetical protein [Phytomonospora endophytica]|uniref:Uncharacterized protein n=1 Tax=Phytomonospora endophytica TaxID=714109 RepID=A0A841FS83_9ACTN|nr:hypothetical protein [Phytomonospora endophytica]MBB6038664.1 hypothetical protein [Phytomonospora endophytica]GIG69192.1 hypothetical protein Pen01_54870 [Phytomonospora endophytica]
MVRLLAARRRLRIALVVPTMVLGAFFASMLASGMAYADDGSYGGDSYGGDSYSGDSYGDDSYGGDSYGDDSYGDDSYGDDSYGDDSYGDDSYGDDSYGEDSYTSDDYGDSYGDGSYEDSYDDYSGSLAEGDAFGEEALGEDPVAAGEVGTRGVELSAEQVEQVEQKEELGEEVSPDDVQENVQDAVETETVEVDAPMAEEPSPAIDAEAVNEYTAMAPSVDMSAYAPGVEEAVAEFDSFVDSSPVADFTAISPDGVFAAEPQAPVEQGPVVADLVGAFGTGTGPVQDYSAYAPGMELSGVEAWTGTTTGYSQLDSSTVTGWDAPYGPGTAVGLDAYGAPGWPDGWTAPPAEFGEAVDPSLIGTTTSISPSLQPQENWSLNTVVTPGVEYYDPGPEDIDPATGSWGLGLSLDLSGGVGLFGGKGYTLTDDGRVLETTKQGGGIGLEGTAEVGTYQQPGDYHVEQYGGLTKTTNTATGEVSWAYSAEIGTLTGKVELDSSGRPVGGAVGTGIGLGVPASSYDMSVKEVYNPNPAPNPDGYQLPADEAELDMAPIPSGGDEPADGTENKKDEEKDSTVPQS